MTEPIDRLETMERLADLIFDKPDGDYFKGVSDAQDVVAKMPTIEPMQWIPVTERLPETEKRVFVTCEHRNIYGKTYPYICKAFHVDRYTMESNADWDEGCDEYREEDDKFYVLEGWYEVIHNWDDYGSVAIEDAVTAWCEQPEPYKGGDADGRP